MIVIILCYQCVSNLSTVLAKNRINVKNNIRMDCTI